MRQKLGQIHANQLPHCAVCGQKRDLPVTILDQAFKGTREDESTCTPHSLQSTRPIQEHTKKVDALPHHPPRFRHPCCGESLILFFNRLLYSRSRPGWCVFSQVPIQEHICLDRRTQPPGVPPDLLDDLWLLEP